MPVIAHVETVNAPYPVTQEETVEIVCQLFAPHFPNIHRLLKVFDNGEIERRHFAAPLEWLKEERSFQEKNDVYIEQCVEMGKKAVEQCLQSTSTDKEEIDAFFFISSSGLSTPTIDIRIMNELSFPSHVKRIPIWGLGCAGGAAGISRAHEYLQAFPTDKVLVLCIELCSLTFQQKDISKSNFIGTSLFADGAACVLMTGEKVKQNGIILLTKDTHSVWLKDSEDVMGWKVKDNGLHVVFSRDIPTLIEKWLKPNVDEFLKKMNQSWHNVNYFIAHPGGKKVLDAYEKSLSLPRQKTNPSREVLRKQGNMSAPTVLYVLKNIIDHYHPKINENGLLTALGPGFCAEMVWVEWRELK